jgi:hypothetical protein
MIMPPEVEDLLRARSFAIIQQYLRGDLEAVLVLVGEDDAELLPTVVEILVGALLRLVSADELGGRLMLGWMSAVPG